MTTPSDPKSVSAQTLDTPATGTPVVKVSDAVPVVPAIPTASTEAAAPPLPAAVVPSRPRYPMPAHFPEVYLPIENRRPAAMANAAPAIPDPHDIHDGHRGYTPARVVCVRCGSSNLAEGQVIDHGDKFRHLLFAPKRVSLKWLNSILSLFPYRSLAKLDAMACRDCGLVQMTVDTRELRQAERRRE